MIQEYAKFMHIQAKERLQDEELYIDSEKACGKIRLPVDVFAEEKKNNGQDNEYTKACLCLDFRNKRFAFALLGLEDESRGRGKHSEPFSESLEIAYR